MTASSAWLVFAAAAILAGCSSARAKSTDIPGRIRESLDRYGFKNIAAGQDRDNGAITLTGFVWSDAARAQAKSVVKSVLTGRHPVSNEIVILKPGDTGSNNDIRVTGFGGGMANNPEAAVTIHSSSDPGSHCQACTDVWLQNVSQRTVLAQIKRSNNVDNQQRF